VPILDRVYVTRILVNDDDPVFGAYGFDLDDGTPLPRPCRRGDPRRRRPQPQHHDRARRSLVWSPTTSVTREEISPIPEEIAALMRDVSTVGKLVE